MCAVGNSFARLIWLGASILAIGIAHSAHAGKERIGFEPQTGLVVLAPPTAASTGLRNPAVVQPPAQIPSQSPPVLAPGTLPSRAAGPSVIKASPPGPPQRSTMTPLPNIPPPGADTLVWPKTPRPTGTYRDDGNTDLIQFVSGNAEGRNLAQSDLRRRGFDRRRAPGREPRKPRPPGPKPDADAVDPPDPNLPREFIPVPDRWRLGHTIGKPDASLLDPYNRNILKGDRPIFGKDWFINLSAISDTVIEPRRIPTPISPVAAASPGTNDVFGDGDQLFYNENIILSMSLIKGNTAYRPQDFELRLTPVFSANRLETSEVAIVDRDPADGKNRNDTHFGLQEAFIDYHIRNVSDRYDFDSIRVGIQPFSTDFRGFLFQDNQLGFRVFGNRSNNIFQYNLAWFRRLEKDTNSGLNSVNERLRDDDIFIGNLYIQDFPSLGFVSQLTGVYNRNREDKRAFFNDNGFIERPASLGAERLRDYDVFYLGYNGDGHFGRANLTVSFYYAFGEGGPNQLSGAGPDDESTISAFFFAAEPSVDFDWLRVRGSFLFASGDSDPFDNKEEGFSAIFENPQFAGGDTSYWIRQGLPLVGGGGVNLTQRNGVLADFRSSKEHGQSNFSNPGIILAGIGFDTDLAPELRLSGNFNNLFFTDTSNLEVLRNQGPIDNHIGYDFSTALIYRPFQSQNVVLRVSGALFIPGDGFKDLFATSADPDNGNEIAYSILTNLVLTY